VLQFFHPWSHSDLAVVFFSLSKPEPFDQPTVYKKFRSIRTK
jgi:hypothetical protein